MIEGGTIRCDHAGCSAVYRDEFGLRAGEDGLTARARVAGWAQISKYEAGRAGGGRDFCPDHLPFQLPTETARR